MPKLGVNIDHVATVRQARGTRYPDPVDAATLAQLGGADQITVHLREDRRHIIDRDVRILRETLQIPLNLEMANTEEMVNIACTIRPDMVTLVPEKREERTTEGGLNIRAQQESLRRSIQRLADAGIPTSLFIEPSLEDLSLAHALKAPMVELHTGLYSELSGTKQAEELVRLKDACEHGHALGLIIHAGHGLNYYNVLPVVKLPHMQDLNIGHSIIARALFVGLQEAVRSMKALITSY